MREIFSAKIPRKLSLQSANTVRAWLLCLPAILIFGIFYVGPMLVGVWHSFHQWNGATAIADAPSVGLNNYIGALQSEEFWADFWVNLLVVGAQIMIMLPLALFLAQQLIRPIRGRTLFRSFIFLPQILSVTAVALIWKFAFDPYLGFLNAFLFDFIQVDSPRIAWLGEQSTALPAAILSFIWWKFGFYMVLFMAGLSSIPLEYYDAAYIETNSRMAILRYVTFPMLREIILIAFALSIGSAFGLVIGYFDILTGGGPAGATEVLGLLMTQKALRAQLYGSASAISILMLLIVLAIIIVPVIRTSRERLEYS